MRKLSTLFGAAGGEGFRVAIIGALFFLLIAANNLLKILRDSIFLGHHSVSELPYLYILVAVVAGLIIASYTKFTAKLSTLKLVCGTNLVIVFNVIFFWALLTYFDPSWSHYAFYIWSAMATVIAVAQVWTLTNQLFTPEAGKRVFGVVAAGGTLGGISASFGAQWWLDSAAETNDLFWFVAAAHLFASVLIVAARRTLSGHVREHDSANAHAAQSQWHDTVIGCLAQSSYLKTIAAVIFLSVVVSTLIDFELKTAAKDAYASKPALAGFFSFYYGWLNVATLFAQLVLTGRTLSHLGLNASLHVTPTVLLTGAVAIMLWPGLLAAALTRIADVTLRNSIHRSSMEIVYMGVPPAIKKAVKTFLDVVVERIGDACAGFVILIVSLSSLASFRTYVHFVCLGLILLWMALIGLLRSGHAKAQWRIWWLQSAFLHDDAAETVRTKQSLGD